jgi:hypothetical protein
MPAFPTPPPVYGPNSFEATPHTSVKCMNGDEKARWRTAAARARTVYPGPVGELVARELLVVEEFGWALCGEALLTRVRADVESRPVKPHVTAQSVARGAS